VTSKVVIEIDLMFESHRRCKVLSWLNRVVCQLSFDKLLDQLRDHLLSSVFFFIILFGGQF